MGKKAKRFKPPTIEEAKEYAKSIGFKSFNAAKWWYFYDAKNWMVGKNKMVRWRSSIQTWFIGSVEWRERQQRENNVPVRRPDCAICHEPALYYRLVKIGKPVDLCRACDKAATAMGVTRKKPANSLSELERKVEQGKAKLAERSQQSKDPELVQADKVQVARQKLMDNFGKG